MDSARSRGALDGNRELATRWLANEMFLMRFRNSCGRIWMANYRAEWHVQLEAYPLPY